MTKPIQKCHCDQPWRALRPRRAGVTIVETVVSAMLLVTVMSFFTTIVYRVDQVWRDTAHHRAAMMELSNQLEQLTLLSADEVRPQLDSLQPSASVASLLTDPVLAAEIVEDQWGSRLVLELNWQRPHPGTPVRLVGWLRPADLASDVTSKADGPTERQEPGL